MPEQQTNTQSTLTKRAWAYVRVSSDGQVNTGYGRDGLSIAAQREQTEDKATRLGAEVIRYWGDPGKSAFTDLHRRTEFLEMLRELERVNQSEATRIDYVIVYALDRWARSVQDHFRTHELVRATGAQLVSVTEPMIGEDTPESFLFEGMQAVHNEYESRRTGRRVSGGILQKAKEGGTYGPARLGYLNDVERSMSGDRVASVSLDPHRASHVRAAFRLYASGDYALSRLANELYELGLRTRPSKKRASGKVGTSALQRLLRDPFYVGLIVYKRGTPDEQVFPGRHEALIDEETFDHVQRLLDEKRLAGERPQKHQHYLRGSVFCGECRKRLTYGFSRSGNGRRYAYYFCACRINGTACSQRRSIPPKLIEEAVERYYFERPVQLKAKDIARRAKTIESLVAVTQQATALVKAAKSELIADLKLQQARLLRLHAEEGDDISPDAFREERKRMNGEIRAAEKSLAATEQQFNLDGAMLRMALELAGDVAKVYRDGSKSLKRGYNQAFFKRLMVKPELGDDGELVVRVVDAELTEPYAVLLADNLAEDVLAEAERIHALSAKTENDPVGPSSTSACVTFEVLAEGVGFEPTGRPKTPNGFQGRRIQPLCHPSGATT